MVSGRKATKPEVFIVESLGFDEERDYREGEVIYRSLRMSGKNPKYHYVRTIAELDHFIDEFEDSNYRYLHISCHGSSHGIALTLEHLSTKEFAGIVGPVLHNRRLFLSTCLAATRSLARAVFAESDCYSVVGPEGEIAFDDSVILWTAFYHLMFKDNPASMKRSHMKSNLSKVSRLVQQNMNYFFQSEDGKTSQLKVAGRDVDEVEDR